MSSRLLAVLSFCQQHSYRNPNPQARHDAYQSKIPLSFTEAHFEAARAKVVGLIEAYKADKYKNDAAQPRKITIQYWGGDDADRRGTFRAVLPRFLMGDKLFKAINEDDGVEKPYYFDLMTDARV
jgi:hypothetical protein